MQSRLDHSPTADTIRIVVIGGGYAGVMAANRLTQRDDLTVTLINPRAAFVHRIRLYQLVAGSGDAVVPYSAVLAKAVRLVVDGVTRIEPAQRRVALSSGATVRYDHLIYALGSGSTELTVPGAAAFAYPVAGLEAAQRARSALAAAPPSAPVTVVGGGPTGIEVATELAEAGRTVTLVCGDVLGAYLHPRVRRTVAERLTELGVAVLAGAGARVTAVTRDAVQLQDGRTLPSTVTLWAAGFGVPDLAARSGLRTDPAGRLLTDETLTSIDDPRIVAAGDAAAPSGLPLRMSCQAAIPLGAHAADTVLNRIAGVAPAPIETALFFQCISLGRRAATVQLASMQDEANRFSLAGPLGAAIKRSSFPGLVWQLGHEGRRPGSYAWPFKNPQRLQQVQAEHPEAVAAP